LVEAVAGTDGDASTDHATPEQAAEFGRAFLGFLEWVHTRGASDGSNPVFTVVREHLGEGVSQSVLTNELPPFEHVNVQTALDHWSAADGRTVTVHGVSVPPHYQAPGLQHLVHGEVTGPVRLAAPDLVDLPSGPDRTTACLRRALLLVEDERGRYIVMVRGPERHEEPVLAVEVAGLPTQAAQGVLHELADLRLRLNVYRGQVVELVPGMGGLSVRFPVLPPTSRDDVVLPAETLRRVERHTLDVVAHRDALRQAGQHLKRGLLLYGPPGTGKTHTTRYVVQQLHGATVLMLSGQSLHAVGPITQLARDLQPSVLVLEDVDLVAEDRGFGPGPSPCCSRCWMRWTGRRRTRTCSSCSRPTGPTCWSPRLLPAQAGSTSRSRSRCPTRTGVVACSRSTPAGWTWRWTTSSSRPSCRGPRVSPRPS
jgi:hypothetical protein